MAKSSSHERRVDTYLRPSTFSKLNEYVEKHEMTKSAVVQEALDAFFGRKTNVPSPFQTSAKRNDHFPE